jgi:arylsulfatase
MSIRANQIRSFAIMMSFKMSITNSSRSVLPGLILLVVALTIAPTSSAADKPNILIIWGDDIGLSNLSVNTRGMMGYRTPNIDSIANEGMLFTDYYGDQSCTAGRSSFITGQSPFRTGLTKVGVPGAELGIQAKDPTIAELLKPAGYATGQFGKNHLGDKDEFLPTNHGFDEFYGNLYHLNAEEEPEHEDYPKTPGFRERFGPRGVIHSFADGKVEDTGPLTRKRMETIDEEFLDATLDFIDRAHTAKKPFFVWFNSTRMHFRTHIPESIRGISGQDFYSDAMVDHDRQVGVLLAKLEELGIAENTIVVYSTDNGPHYNTWPDGANSPFRGEKNTNWEGGYRVPGLVRWPGKIAPGSVSNEIMSHLDWAPTLLAAAGEPDIKGKLLKGHKAGAKKFKAHLDGYNFLPHLTGKAKNGPRQEFLYFNDDGLLVGTRVGDWKMVFAEQRARRFDVWREPFVFLRIPKIFHLRRDPYEKADTDSNQYNEWWTDRVPLIFNAQVVVAQFLGSLREFPPSQRPASFTIDQIFEGALRQLEQP